MSGRPKISAIDRRTIRLQTIVSEREYDWIKKRADDEGRSVSSLLRLAILADYEGEP